MKRIAGGLSNVERHVQQAVEALASANSGNNVERQSQMAMTAPGHVVHPQAPVPVTAPGAAARVQVVGSEQSLEQQLEDVLRQISALELSSTSARSSSTAHDERVSDNVDGKAPASRSSADRLRVSGGQATGQGSRAREQLRLLNSALQLNDETF